MLLALFLTISCDSSYESYLENGLIDFERSVNIKKELIEGISIEKLAVFEVDNNTYDLVLMLNKDIKKELVERYGVALKAVLNEKNVKLRNHKADHNFKSFSFYPKMKIYNENKYIVTKIKTKIESFDNLAINLSQFENEEFIRHVGNVININNIVLKKDYLE